MFWYEPIRCLMRCTRHRWHESCGCNLPMPRRSYRDLNEEHVAWRFHREYEHHEHVVVQSVWNEHKKKRKKILISALTHSLFTCFANIFQFFWLISWRNSSKGIYRQRFVRWHAKIIIKKRWNCKAKGKFVVRDRCDSKTHFCIGSWAAQFKLTLLAKLLAFATSGASFVEAIAANT